jgi:hypothetical protein
MLRGLLNVVGLVLALAVLIFLLTGVWIVYDGLHDHYQKAEMALVPGYAEIQDGKLSVALTARLDRAAALYAQGVVAHIVVSGVTPPREDDETEAMARYLEGQGVSADAITQVHPAENAGEAADNLALFMKDRSKPVVLVADYYRLTRLKLTLWHGGVRGVQQVHIGEWRKEDIMAVLNEDVRFYQEVNQWYVLPAWKKTSETVSGGCQAFVDSLNTFLNPEMRR